MKKFSNKSKEYRSPLFEYKPQCSMCGGRCDNVKLRKMYDYINDEYHMEWLCDKCEWSILEDSLL